MASLLSGCLPGAAAPGTGEARSLAGSGARPRVGRPSPSVWGPPTGIEAARVGCWPPTRVTPPTPLDPSRGPPDPVSPLSPAGPERSDGPRRVAPGRDKWGGPASAVRREWGGDRLCSPARPGGVDRGERGGTLGHGGGRAVTAGVEQLPGDDTAGTRPGPRRAPPLHAEGPGACSAWNSAAWPASAGAERCAVRCIAKAPDRGERVARGPRPAPPSAGRGPRGVAGVARRRGANDFVSAGAAPRAGRPRGRPARGAGPASDDTLTSRPLSPRGSADDLGAHSLPFGPGFR